MENSKRKLPPWKIFAKACSVVWKRRWFALYISLPVLLIHLVHGVAADMGYVPAVFSETPTGSDSEASDDDALTVLDLVSSFFLVMVAIYWHRGILLSEYKRDRIPLRFDAVFWRYILYAIACFVVLMALALGVSALATTLAVLIGILAKNVVQPGSPLLLGLAVVAITPIFLYITVVWFRLSLVLPATAIGHRDFGFRAAWTASKGCNWQILGIGVLTVGFTICVGLIFLLVFLLLSLDLQVLKQLELIPQTFWSFLYGILVILQSLIGVGTLSLTYAYLVHAKRDAPAGELA